MLSIALYSPRIPQNVGAVARLTAALGSTLHIIRPIPFSISDPSLQRAGLDYWPHVQLVIHEDWSAFAAAVAPRRPWVLTTRGTQLYTEARFAADDILLFGNEPHGLPAEIRDADVSRQLVIPLPNPAVRSLNVAMCAGIVAYEALRQLGS